jgi:beta-lactamase superfamily II metal-dependent hydrolase
MLNTTPVLVQIPHHGSKNNHVEDVWNNLNLKNSHTFLSAGNKYDHPSQLVETYFKKNSLEYSNTKSHKETRKRTIENTPVIKKNRKNNKPQKEGKKLVYKIDCKTNSCELVK